MNKETLNKIDSYLEDYHKFLNCNGHISNIKQDCTNIETNMSPYFDLIYFDSLKNDCKRNFVIIPSIFNSPDILYFSKDNNFIKFLQKFGNCIILQWKFNDTNPDISDITIEAKRIIGILDARIDLVGHCFGGTIAMAVSQLSDRINSLTLLTCTQDLSHFSAAIEIAEKMNYHSLYSNVNKIPKIFFQIMFFLFLPQQFIEKINRYWEVKPECRAQYLLIEFWLHSGVDISRRLYEDLISFFVRHDKDWQIDGKTIKPDNINIPCFLTAARDDPLIPVEMVKQLSKRIKNSQFQVLKGGHLSYLINSIEQLYTNYSDWLLESEARIKTS